MNHVSSTSFGIRYKADGITIDDFAFVEHVFRNLPQFKTEEETKVALDMAFDAFYGLQRLEEAGQRPLSSIGVSPLEEYGRNGPLFKALEIYTKSSIAEFFPGFTVMEFMNLPREEREYMLIISETRKAERYQEEQAALSSAGLGKNGLNVKGFGLPKK